MRDRTLKVEQYKLWFYDLNGTAQLLSEKSAMGYHLQSVDVDSGKFTYKRGEAENYYYEIVVNSDTKNLAVYTDAYEKVCEATGLTFYRKKEDAKEGIITEKHSFKTKEISEEEQYLSEKAKEGYVLLRCSKPEYVFEMCGESDITYKIDYCEDVENPEEYINKFKQAGFEYLWGYNGDHYCYSENGKDIKSDIFDNVNQHIEKKKSNEFESIIWVAVIGIICSVIKIFLDYRKYINAVAADVLQTVSKSLIMDALAVAVCVAFLIWVFIKRKKQ